MTAINVFLNRDVVHLMTDGASYNEDAVMVRRTSKAVMIPHLSLAFAARGTTCLSAFVAMAIEHANSYDDLKLRAGELLGSMVSALAEAIGFKFDPIYEVVIVGIDNRGNPDAYAVVSHGEKAWKVQQVVDVLLAPTNAELHQLASVIAMGAYAAGRELDPLLEGQAIMEQQREHYAPTRIGAFMQHTRIGRDRRCSSRILRFWPDEIGNPIGVTECFSATSGAIGDLAVSTFSLANNAVTIPQVAEDAASHGGGAGLSGAANFCAMTISVDSTRLAVGTPITIMFNCAFNASIGGGSIIGDLRIIYAGTDSVLKSRDSNQNGNWTYPIVASYTFPAAGGVDVLQAYLHMQWFSASFSKMIICALTAKR